MVVWISLVSVVVSHFPFKNLTWISFFFLVWLKMCGLKKYFQRCNSMLYQFFKNFISGLLLFALIKFLSTGFEIICSWFFSRLLRYTITPLIWVLSDFLKCRHLKLSFQLALLLLYLMDFDMLYLLDFRKF